MMIGNDDGDQEDDGGDVVVDGQDKPRQCVSQIDTNPLTLRKKIKANVLAYYFSSSSAALQCLMLKCSVGSFVS